MSAAIPCYGSPLIGRQSELECAQAFLRAPGESARLLTLTGPGGVGKTRLAAHLAAEWSRNAPAGAHFVSLAHLADAALLPATVARALNMQETGSLPLKDALRDYLRSHTALLVLDNFEQLLPHTSFVDFLLAGCPGLRLIVTSRAPLGLPTETKLPVPPLVTPDLANLPSAYVLSNYAAVSLFIQSAQMAEPTFSLSQENAAAIAEICVRLDGLPLAIELAAARIRSIPPVVMRERLHARLMLLVGGQRLPARHQSLRAAIDWTYDLLSPEQRILFARVAVFAGWSAAESIEAVCRDGNPKVPELTAIPALLDQLASHSVVMAGPAGPERRYTLSDTVREYALERLAERGETSLAHRNHAAYYLALAQQAEPHLRGPKQSAWFERLEKELENLRAALAWALDSGQYQVGLALVGALDWFWFVRGHLTEGRDWANRFLSHPPTTFVSPALRARALLTAARLFNQSDAARSEAYAQEAHDLARSLQDARLIGEALLALGRGAANHGDLIATAANYYQQSLFVFQQAEFSHGIADALYGLGLVANDRGAYSKALLYYEQSLELRRLEGDMWGMARTLTSMAYLTGDMCEFSKSEQYGNQSRELYRQLGDRGSAAAITHNLAHIAHLRGEYALAKSLCQEAFSIWHQSGRQLRLTLVLRMLAAIALGEGQLEQAETLADQAMEIARRANFKRGAMYPLIVMSQAAAWRGEFARAKALLEEGTALAKEVSDRIYIGLAALAEGQRRLLEGDPGCDASLLNGLATLRATGDKIPVIELLEWIGMARAAGSPLMAARLFGAAAEARRQSGTVIEPIRRPRHEAALGAAKAAGGEAAFAQAWAEGQGLTLEAAAELALAG